MQGRARLLLMTLLLPLAAEASWAWLGGAAVAALDDSDWTLLQATTRAAFADAEDGERRDWRNEASGNGGAVKPLLSFVDDGRRCRRMAFLVVTERNGRGVATHTLCAEETGGFGYLPPSEHPR